MEPDKFYSYFPNDPNCYNLIDFYYFLSDDNFIKILKVIIDQKGYSDGVTGIFFSNSFEKWEEEYFPEGVMICVNEKELLVSDEVFLKYTKIAIEIYLKIHPEDTEEVEILYLKIENKFSKGFYSLE